MSRILLQAVKSILRPLILRVLRWPIVTAFHYVYYTSSDTWLHNRFLGYPILQNPLDLQLYQELIFLVKPRYIIHTGIAHGGSVLYFAHLLDLVNAAPDAVIIGIDIELLETAKTISHRRARLIIGDSTASDTIN